MAASVAAVGSPVAHSYKDGTLAVACATAVQGVAHMASASEIATAQQRKGMQPCTMIAGKRKRRPVSGLHTPPLQVCFSMPGATDLSTFIVHRQMGADSRLLTRKHRLDTRA